jgi:hypothetical protein
MLGWQYHGLIHSNGKGTYSPWMLDMLSGRSQIAINTKMLPSTSSRPTALFLLFGLSMSNLHGLMSLATNQG